MSYYDHATAMAYQLKPWDKERVLRNYEVEALASEQRMLEGHFERPSFYRRCLTRLAYLTGQTSKGADL